MKTLVTGIAGFEQMKARTMAIAQGKYKPAKNEPTVWFTSVESFARVLSERNRELLALIAREKPHSLTELAELAGRKKIQPLAHSEDDVAIWAGGIEGGSAWQVDPASYVRPGALGRFADFGAWTH